MDVVVSWPTDIVVNVGRNDAISLRKMGILEDPYFLFSTLAWGVVADGHSLFDACLYTSGRFFQEKVCGMSRFNFPLSAPNKQVKHDLILWENWQKRKVWSMFPVFVLLVHHIIMLSCDVALTCKIRRRSWQKAVEPQAILSTAVVWLGGCCFFNIVWPMSRLSISVISYPTVSENSNL